VEESILVLELITEGRVCPSPWLVVALILKAKAILVGVITEEAVGKNETQRIAAALALVIDIQPARVVVVHLKAVLPARWKAQRKFKVSKKIV